MLCWALNAVICGIQYEKSGCNLLPAFLIDSERSLIVWPDLLVFGAEWVLSYNCMLQEMLQVKFLRGQTTCGSSFGVFPIPHLPLPTLKSHTLPWHSVVEQHHLPGYSAFHAAHYTQCAFWAKALLISWRHLAAFQFYSEWKVNADVLGFGSLHPPSWLKNSIVTYLNKVVHSEQLMIKSLHKMWNM